MPGHVEQHAEGDRKNEAAEAADHADEAADGADIVRDSRRGCA